MKISHKSNGKSFGQIFKNSAEKVKLRGKEKIEVFGLILFVSWMKYQKNGKTEYLIVASKQHNKYAIEEYKVRWQIETRVRLLEISQV